MSNSETISADEPPYCVRYNSITAGVFCHSYTGAAAEPFDAARLRPDDDPEEKYKLTCEASVVAPIRAWTDCFIFLSWKSVC